MQQVATYESVSRACELLKGEGQKVTGRAVLAITGGSLGTVLGLIKEWRKGDTQTSALLPSEIPAELQTSLLRALALARAEAETKLKEEIEQANAREAEALEGLANAESHIEKNTGQLAGLRTQLDQGD
ncbi:MAG: DNA-binding protein [Syntrophotaleaceae bacterium]